MKVHLCDRCATIVYDSNDSHMVLMQVSNALYKEEYYKVVDLCPDCYKKTVENFEDFINVCD